VKGIHAALEQRQGAAAVIGIPQPKFHFGLAAVTDRN